jgi:3-methyladenine DNA glycosylase AlkD
VRVLTEIQKKLCDLKDEKYREFTSKLIPEISKDEIIGVRTPHLKNLAKEIYLKDDYEKFLEELPHKYHEENLLHGFIIGKIKEYEKALGFTEKFLPYVNNWAVCDSLRPASFRKNKSSMLKSIKQWVKSGHVHTILFGVERLMCHYLNDDFKEDYLEIPAEIKSEEYYVRMAQAWLVSVCLVKEYDKTVELLKSNRLDLWTHNKSISKAKDSFRISKEQKNYLKSLRRKHDS